MTTIVNPLLVNGVFGYKNSMYVQHQDTSSSGGAGSSASNTNNIRLLNTVVWNNIVGAALTVGPPSFVSLPAGTYIVYSVGATNTTAGNASKQRLYNLTDAAYFGEGALSNFSAGGTHCFCMGILTIAATKSIQAHTYTQTGLATNGLGVGPNGLSNAGPAMYCDLLIIKVA